MERDENCYHSSMKCWLSGFTTSPCWAWHLPFHPPLAQWQHTDQLYGSQTGKEGIILRHLHKVSLLFLERFTVEAREVSENQESTRQLHSFLVLWLRKVLQLLGWSAIKDALTARFLSRSPPALLQVAGAPSRAMVRHRWRRTCSLCCPLLLYNCRRQMDAFP